MGSNPKLSIGLQTEAVANLGIALKEAIDTGFDFLATPLYHPSFIQSHYGKPIGSGFRSDMVLSSSQWSSTIVGVCSPWINLTSSFATASSSFSSLASNEKDYHQQQLYNELAHASHLSLPTVLLPSPPLNTHDCVNYARYLHKLTQEGAIHCWVPLPITLPLPSNDSDLLSSGTNTLNSSLNKRSRLMDHADHAKNTDSITPETSSDTATSLSPITSAWKIWNTIRCLSDTSSHLSIALILTDNVPTDTIMNHWLGEPVRCVIIPSSLFITLSDDIYINTVTVKFRNPRYESLFQKFYKFGAQFILHHEDNTGSNSNGKTKTTSGVSPSDKSTTITLLSSSSSSSSSSSTEVTSLGYAKLRPYVNYLQSLITLATLSSSYSSTTSSSFSHDNFVASLSAYNDYLQIPLQPLADHLSNTTYEVFEQDKPKYMYYQRAIEHALYRFQHSSVYRQRVIDCSADEPLIQIMVVGAGRGPLVNCVLQAASKLGCFDNIDVAVVEKNPHAISTLVHLCDTNPLWKQKVRVFAEDMRTWNPPRKNAKADILVSELLGSFSDNELSPECLDGAERLLHVPWGVSIPYQYTSYLAPIMSAKLWNNVGNLNDKKYYETPFVVRMHNYTLLQPPQPVFTFTHPHGKDGSTTRINSLASTEGSSPPDNRRYTKLRFHFTTDALIHGLAGYFDATLIPSVNANDVSSLSSSSSSLPIEKKQFTVDTSTMNDEVKLSIVPSSHTPRMESWFPIFFPLRNPVTVQPNDYIDVSIWRCVETVGSISKGGGTSSLLGKRVWYEYSVQTSSNVVTHIHNSAGKCHSIGL